MFTVDLFLNDGFLGDNQQVRAIQTQLIQKYPDAQFATYQDSDTKAVAELSQNFNSNPNEQHIFILSGSHGFEFIQKNPDVQSIIEQKKPIVIWFGHQNPGAGVQSVKEYLNIVALPKYILADQPELTSYFKDNCVSMTSVPNTLTKEALATAQETWNSTYPVEKIRPAENGYMGIFLGGDAPKPDGTYLYWDIKEAQEQGLAFGKKAIEENKSLLITNGPRTGKFDPQSPDPKNPVVRGTHTESAPLDLVSAAFLAGLKESGIPETQYQFFDFKFGKPAKSAYKAMVAALRETPGSVAIYSGESISYAEIAYFVPHTYVFRTQSMNEGHEKALQQFKTSSTIEELDLTKLFSTKPITLEQRTRMYLGATHDIDAIIHRLDDFIKPANTPQEGFTPLRETNILPQTDRSNTQKTLIKNSGC